jgi:hypothetical protein
VYANTRRLDDQQIAAKLARVDASDLRYQLSFRRTRQAIELEQDYATNLQPLANDKLANPPENASLGGKHGLMLQVVSCKGQGRPQVLLHELRIGLEQIRKRAAGAELAQYQLYCNAGAFDAWLTHHDSRIGGDAGVWHVGSAIVSHSR